MTRIVDPWPWLEQEIIELDRRYAPELDPLKRALAEANDRQAKKVAQAELAPVMSRYLAERQAIEVRRRLPW